MLSSCQNNYLLKYKFRNGSIPSACLLNVDDRFYFLVLISKLIDQVFIEAGFDSLIQILITPQKQSPRIDKYVSLTQFEI